MCIIQNMLQHYIKKMIDVNPKAKSYEINIYMKYIF
jgi:hypothetical protein